MQTELERREARLALARRRLAELTAAPVEAHLDSGIEEAHRRVEDLERRLANTRMKALAVRLRVQLSAAREAEQELLSAHGYDSWLGYQLRRVEHMLHRTTAAELAEAELEHELALASLREIVEALESVGVEEPEAVSVPSTIGPCPTAWSASPI